MDKLLIGLEATKDNYKEQICKDFFDEFGVNLRDSRYNNGEFSVKWELLLQECSYNKGRESLPELIHMFNEKLFNVIYFNPILHSTANREKKT